MSVCAESNYADSYVSEWDESSFVHDETLFEKPRGQRRWLGKEQHRGKERLHNSVKDRTFIEKTVKMTGPISEKVADKIEGNCQDELKINVVYSMDKKNRWNDATTITLLGGAPENLNAEVVEKNALEQYGFMYPNKSTFAVHSRKVTEADGEFEIRSATSSGQGQDYSNFLPKSREFSKKANARTLNIREEENKSVEQPTVTYNIYKTHRSQDVVGSEMFKAKTVSKSGRHRANKKVDMEVYDDDEEYSDEEDDLEEANFYSRNNDKLDLTDYMVTNEKKQAHRSKRNDSEISYEIIDPEIEFSQQFNIQEYLQDEGFTFIETDITFSNQTECFEDQIDRLRQEKKLKIKDLRPNQYLVDVSNLSHLGGFKKDGETNTVMIFTHLKENNYNVILNSTIISHPQERTANFLKSLISSSKTILEAVTRVAGLMFQNRNTTELIRLSGSYYGEKDISKLLNDASTWENQLKRMLKVQWPNQNYHSTWANSEELSQVGGKLEWNDLCEMVKKENRMRTCYTFEDRCGSCNLKKRSHELFLVENESKVKCTDCLRNEFYREFIAKRLPIDLETDTAVELEYLPAFIPLTLLNFYIRTVAETIYKDLGATGDFEKCPSCKSAVFFEETGKKSQNRSCPCGYSWCKDCKKVPHWPMNCKDYCEWEKKWNLRYSMMNAQGSGNETLSQITCFCGKGIYTVLLPTEETIYCPGCKTPVNPKTMHVIMQQSYWPFSPRYRERQRMLYQEWEGKDNYPYDPIADIRTSISKIPAIKSSVMEICGAARDIRFNAKVRNHLVKQEQVLIRKNILEKEVVDNLCGTVVYLVENVTAWMNMTNRHDRMVKTTLESMMEDRRAFIELMDGENQEAITSCIKKLRNEIDSVVSAVKKMKENVETK